MHHISGDACDLRWYLDVRAGDTAENAPLTERAHDKDNTAKATAKAGEHRNHVFPLLFHIICCPVLNDLFSIIAVAIDHLKGYGCGDNHEKADKVVDECFRRAELSLLVARIPLKVSKDNLSVRPLLIHIFVLDFVWVLQAKCMKIVLAEEEGCNCIYNGEVSLCADVSVSESDHEEAVDDEAYQDA